MSKSPIETLRAIAEQLPSEKRFTPEDIDTILNEMTRQTCNVTQLIETVLAITPALTLETYEKIITAFAAGVIITHGETFFGFVEETTDQKIPRKKINDSLERQAVLTLAIVAEHNREKSK